MMLNIGAIVKVIPYGYEGIVDKSFINWNDLKQKEEFLTIEPNPNETSYIERLINDPKDEWLRLQKIPFSKNNLLEKWYTIKCFDGGSVWTCESKIEILN